MGQPLTLQCEVTTVRGIISRVDIAWSSNGTVLRRINDTTATTMNNSLVYTDFYTISMLNTFYNGRTYDCKVVINTDPSIMISNSLILNVNGEYSTLYTEYKFSDQFLSIVPDPTITIQPPGPVIGAMVGNPLNANCIVSTVDGVEFTDVMISWTGPGVSANRFIMGDIISLGNNTYSRTLQLQYLLKIDENNPYFCIVMILEGSATESFEIESLTGEYMYY